MGFREYDRKRRGFERRYNTSYEPHLRKWVTQNVWRAISSDMILFEDTTDPCLGEPANDPAVVDFLLQRGKYKPAKSCKVGERFYPKVSQKFKEIKWPQMPKHSTYTSRLDTYLTRWFDLARTVPQKDMPRDKDLAKIMAGAIEPWFVRAAVHTRMECGRSEVVAYYSDYNICDHSREGIPH